MIKPFQRHTRIAMLRVQRKKSPFMYKAYSKKPKHRELRRRKRRESRFQIAGFLAILIAFVFLASLIFNVISNGQYAFREAEVKLAIDFDPVLIQQDKYRNMIQNALLEAFPDMRENKSRRARGDLFQLVSRNASFILKSKVERDPDLIGTKQDIWLPASSAVSVFYKRHFYKQSEWGGDISAQAASWITYLAQNKSMRMTFNWPFFQNGDSREAERAGVLVATIGSFMTILVCIFLAFPLGVATAIYLEEFAPKNWFTSFIEININNLAAVPSIIFGLLGLAVFLNFFGMERSSSLVGGMVLALLILPVIVIATRNALRAVPPSIRFAAAALGATPTQVAFHHTFIYALPGIMTGVILSVARAFGETAPLLMIGMVAFVADIPKSFSDPATTLPVQVYLWANNPELGFVEKTAAAIMVLLGFMILINMLAIYIRRRFEIKW